MSIIESGLQAVKARITEAARRAGRDPAEVGLLAVSKTLPASAVREAYAAGQHAFAENYAQEGVAKIEQLRELPLEWHFIGPIQSNKTRIIAEHFDWVESVDRVKVAERLAAARPEDRGPLRVCIQVNISNEANKSGAEPGEVLALARRILELPELELRGLMGIAEATADQAVQRSQFAILRRLREELAANGIGIDTLSMGMSQDLEAAIIEGSTLVRIGTAIFGERKRT